MITNYDIKRVVKYIIKLLLAERVVISTYLTKKVKEKFNLNRHQIRRLIKKLEKHEVIKITQISKKIFQIELANPQRALDLSFSTHARNSQHIDEKQKTTTLNPEIAKIATSCLYPSPKLRMSELLRELTEYYTKTKVRKDDKNLIISNFELYINDVIDKCLVFKDTNDEIQVLPYSTRFTSLHKSLEQKEKIEQAFKKATLQYSDAIFLTITLPPVFPLKIQFWALSFVLHRIKALIRRKTKKTAPHIKVTEPHNDFRPHHHVILFGVSFLMDKRELTKYIEKHLTNFLSKLGEHYKRTINKRATDEQVEALNALGNQLLRKYEKYKKRNKNYDGPINYIKKIEKTTEGFLIEEKDIDRAIDGGMISILDYIKFYVMKNSQLASEVTNAITSNKPIKIRDKTKNYEVLAFYWLFRTPFFTISPALRTEKKVRFKVGWIFLFSCYLHEIDYLLNI